jgi:type I restriction enzyme, S subunit
MPSELAVADWPQVTVKEIARDIVGGGTPARDVASFWDGDVPWVTPGELTRLRRKTLGTTAEMISLAGLASSGAKLVPAGALIVTTRATIGLAALTSVPTATNQGFKSVVFSDRADPSFYYHVFLSLKHGMERWASGTTFLEISAREFSKLIVPLPELAEQRRIARILDAADQAIRSTEHLIAKLEQIKRGLLHDLLSRGIGEDGRLRDPVAHPEEFAEGGLGGRPATWTVMKVEDILKHVIDFRGRTPKKLGMNWGQGEVPALSASNVKMGTIDTATEAYLGSYGLYERWMTQGATRRGDVLLTMEAPLGNVAQIPDDKKYILSQRVVLLRFDKRLVSNDFMYWCMRGPSFQRSLIERSSGTTATGIQRAQLEQLLVPVPAPAEQEQIATSMFSVEHRLQAEKHYLDKLVTQKHGLVSDLLSARVRVNIGSELVT